MKLCALPLFALLATVGSAQDLLERAREVALGKQRQLADQAKPRTFVGRNSLSLHLTPGFSTPDSGRKSVSIRFGADVGWQQTCGRFSVYANALHHFREIMERGPELLADVAEGYIAGSAWNTLCQASPLLCENAKFGHLSAMALGQLDFDKCAHIEEAIDSGIKQGRSMAIQGCLKDKLAANVPLAQALKECERSEEQLTDLLGNRVVRFDMIDELKKLFQLDADSSRDVQLLLGDRKISTRRFEGVADSTGGQRLYEKIKESYKNKWQEALDDPPDDRELSKLLPYGDLQVIRTELNLLGLLAKPDREMVLDSIVSQAALAEMVIRLHRLERMLETAMRLPGLAEAPQRLKEYERDRDRVRREIDRLQREYADKVATHERYLRTLDILRSKAREIAHDSLGRDQAIETARAKLRSIPVQGDYNPLGRIRPSSNVTSSGATPCCEPDYGFGRTR
jgi:hypothetical protein